MDLTGFTLNFDVMEVVGKSVADRRKVLKRIARDKQATINYWIHRSSDEFVVNWVKNHHFRQRTSGQRMFDRVDCINITLPDRHRLLDEIAGTDKAIDRQDTLWAIVKGY